MLQFATPRVTPAVRGLIIATVSVYVLQILPGVGDVIMGYGALIPARTFLAGDLWRLVTYLFIHAVNPLHVLFNMLALWMFGVELEQMWGQKKFLTFYFVTGVGAGLFNLILLTSPGSEYVQIIGASGAVLGLLTAYAWYYPHRQILVMFLFPLPVRTAVLIFGAISLLFAMNANAGGISHLTHLGGIVVAFAYLKWGPSLTSKFEDHRERREERQMRARVEQRYNRKKHFEDVVDPILKKISQSGMESLTREERKILENASKSNPEEMRKSKIIPFYPKKR